MNQDHDVCNPGMVESNGTITTNETMLDKITYTICHYILRPLDIAPRSVGVT